jgi:hypothetical protein
LSGYRGWEMQNHHFEKGVSCRQELAHDDLQQWFAFKILLFVCELDLELGNKRVDLFLLVGFNGIEDLENRVENELVEGTFKSTLTALSPLLGLWIEEIITLYNLLEQT